ncbi:MAG: helix-turn-helix domain-containing protein [Acidobacteriota bacterium]
MSEDAKSSMQPTLLLTAQEAADYLRIPLGSLYVRIHKKQIPCIRLGRLLRFRQADLDALMKPSPLPRRRGFNPDGSSSESAS